MISAKAITIAHSLVETCLSQICKSIHIPHIITIVKIENPVRFQIGSQTYLQLPKIILMKSKSLDPKTSASIIQQKMACNNKLLPYTEKKTINIPTIIS